MSEANISLGVKRSELEDGYKYCSPCCPDSDDPAKKKEWEDTIVYPELSIDGKHAMLMGADDLNVDDVVEVTLKLKVKGKRDNSTRTEDKIKREVSITFCLLDTSDLVAIGEDKDGDDEVDGAAEVEASEEAAPVRELMASGGGGRDY